MYFAREFFIIIIHKLTLFNSQSPESPLSWDKRGAGGEFRERMGVVIYPSPNSPSHSPFVILSPLNRYLSKR